MKMLCTLVSTRVDGEDNSVLAISPSDNVWFVPPANFTPETREIMLKLESQPGVVVLGAIFVGDDV